MEIGASIAAKQRADAEQELVKDFSTIEDPEALYKKPDPPKFAKIPS